MATTAALQDCLDRHRAGDPSAREDLIRHSRDRLHHLTHQMLKRCPGVRRWEDTSDVLQNVLVRLDRALRRTVLPTPIDLLRFAARLIRCELVDLTKHYFGPEGPGRHQVTPAPGRHALDPQAPTRTDAWHDLHQAITALPDEDQALFDLLYYQELTQAEAAGLLGLAERTLKRRWRDAKLRLMERLGGRPVL